VPRNQLCEYLNNFENSEEISETLYKLSLEEEEASLRVDFPEHVREIWCYSQFCEQLLCKRSGTNTTA